LSSTTVLHARRVLSTALAAAARDDRLARNVAPRPRSLTGPEGRQRPAQGLTTDQAKAALVTAADDRLASR
jgi:hypothetical protein